MFAIYGRFLAATNMGMLDQIGPPAAFGLETSAELFGPRADLLHTTSALRYPVVRNGANYTGHAPAPLGHPYLKRMVETLLVAELCR